MPTAKMKPLPCPHCGGRAKVKKYPSDLPEITHDWFVVSCPPCNPCSAWPLVTGDSRHEAVSKWNRRDLTKELAASELMMRQFLATVLRRIGGSAFLDALHPEDRDPKIQIVIRRGHALAEVRVGR